MPVTFPKLNIISKSAKIPNIPLVSKCTLNFSLPADFYKTTYYRMAPLGDILNEICGIYSSEDIKKISKMKKSYSKLSQEELYNLQQTSIKSYLNNVKSKLGLEAADKNGELYTFNQLNLTPKYQSEMKAEQLKLVAIKQALNRNNPEISWIQYSKWLDCNIGTPSHIPAKTIYEHPCDNILRTTGILNSKEIADINNLMKKYETKSIFQIFEEKSKVLEKMQQHFCGKNSDLIGQYSERELAEMKRLVQKYLALNAIQTRSGYFSKHLEMLLYSKPNKFEPKEYVNGLGIITDKVTLDGIEGIVSFIFKNNEFILSMHDASILKLKNDLLNSIPETICIEELNDINKKAKNIINMEPKSLISEIRFKIMDKNNIGMFFEKRKEDKNKVYEIMGNNKYSYLIMNFRNFYKNKYQSTGKSVGIKLLKLLKDTDSAPVFLIASPFQSTHSPVSMYLRMGFKPLFKTEKEVYNAMSNHCEYMNKEPLAMYVENLDVFGNRIDNLNQIYFANAK